MGWRIDRRAGSALLGVVLAASSLGLSACGVSKEDEVTPSEARSGLIETIEKSAAQLKVEGWNRDHAAEVGDCGSRQGERVNYTYGYGAPAPDSDRAADARTIANYWRSLGMQVRLVESPDYVVYASGGPVTGLSFSTAPGDYYIAGESLCVPGDATELREQDNG